MSSHNTHYDYFVIGAGSGGARSARIAASHGARVGIAEDTAFGGTCVNRGCVPKKIFAYAADYASDFKDSTGYGWQVTPPALDWPTLTQNTAGFIERLNTNYETGQDKAGVDIYRGTASFIDPHTLEVNGEKITADHFLIAVGGAPHKPDIPGKELLSISDDMFQLPALPDEVIILGGGYIGVEFTHILHGLGVKVTLVHYKAEILRGFDRDLTEHLTAEMRKQGIELCLSCEAVKVEKEQDKLHVFTNDDRVLTADLVLAATGRRPRLDTLGMENVDLKLTSYGRIEVNEHYQTSQPHIYAIGDVTDTYHLTPVAIREGHALADNLFGGHNRHVNYENLPSVVFSRPPIGTIGLSEEEAREKGYGVEIFKTTFRPMKFALPDRDEKTLMKLVVDKKTDKVLGCHMIGLDAPEIMQGFAVAMNAGATKADFDRTVAIHPVSAEEFVTMREPVSSE